MGLFPSFLLENNIFKSFLIMNKISVFVLFATAISLSGCHGIERVSFEVFKEKASEAVQKAPKVEYTSYKGKYGDKRLKFSTNQKTNEYSSEELFFVFELQSIDSVQAMYNYMSVKNSEFYVGFGFKVINSGTTYEYSQKGYLTNIKGTFSGKSFHFSVSHKFNKQSELNYKPRLN